MSLMENHPRPSSRQKHRSSLPPLATTPFFQEQSSSPRRHHHPHQYHQGRRHTKHRLSNASASSYTSTNSTSSTSFSSSIFPPRSFNTFELVFTNLIDALIFTSAVAITAYNYWMGYIVDPPRIYGSSPTGTPTIATSSPPKPPSPCVLLRPFDIPSPPLSVLSTSSPSSPTPAQPEPTSLWSDLKRMPEQQSVSSNKRLHTQENDAGPSLPYQQQQSFENEEEEVDEEEEERVNRMEETLQELIRQGQAALTSPIDWK